MDILDGMEALAARYDGFILDLWGVLHDGERPYPGVVECLERLIALDLRVVLLSNAPQRLVPVMALLEGLGLHRALYHHLMTSGEATFEALDRRTDPWHARLGRRCLHLGPERDRPLFAALDGIELVADPDDAEFVVNTGPSTYDDDPEDYTALLVAAAGRGLPMICANPDLEVMVGPRVVPCAGTFARRYRALGGEVVYHGKPHPAVYQRCFALLGIADRSRILAMGDTLHTDVAGAVRAGIDAALVTGGLLCAQVSDGWGERPDPLRLAAVLAGAAEQPVVAVPCLRW